MNFLRSFSASLTLLVVGLVIGCSREETPAPSAASPQSTTSSAMQVPAGEQSPLDVVRDFVLAMTSLDQTGVERVILPNPDAAVLWQGQPPPPDLKEQILAQIQSMTLKDFKPGDTIFFPNGRQMSVTEQVVDGDHKIVLPIIEGQPMPVPLPMVRVDGEWKVDATPLINLRRAAADNRPAAGASVEP